MTHSEYEIARHRLGAAIARIHPEVVPSVEQLETVVFDYFDDRDFALCSALLNPPSEGWHSWRIGDAAVGLESDYDEWNTCPSLGESLAAARAMLLSYRLRPDAIACHEDGSIVVSGGGMPLITIAPIEFSTAPDEMTTRVERALAGDRRRGDGSRVTARLREVHGLSALVTQDDDGRKPFGATLLPLPSTLATQMRTALQDVLDLQVKQHEAQEIVAAMLGAPSWHALATPNHRICWKQPAMLTLRNPAQQEEIESVRWYRTEQEAAAVLAAYLAGCHGSIHPYFSKGLMHALFSLYGSTIAPEQAKSILDPDWWPGHKTRIEVTCPPQMYADIEPTEAPSIEEGYRACQTDDKRQSFLANLFGVAKSADEHYRDENLSMGIARELRIGDWLIAEHPSGSIRHDVRFEKLAEVGRAEYDIVPMMGAILQYDPAKKTLKVHRDTDRCTLDQVGESDLPLLAKLLKKGMPSWTFVDCDDAERTRLSELLRATGARSPSRSTRLSIH